MSNPLQRLVIQLAFAALLVLPQKAVPQTLVSEGAGIRIEAAFRNWMQDNGADQGTLAVLHKGMVQHKAGIGMAVDTPVELASLSKAITAACVADLVARGQWSRDTNARDVLEDGPDVSLKALLTHTSGYRRDVAGKLMWRRLGRKGDQSLAIARRLAKAAPSGPKASYFYTNDNYAVLGAMLETVYKGKAQDACNDRVLKPAGVTTAQRSPRTGGFLHWGGWEMTVQDYAVFHWASFGPKGRIGQDERRWPSVQAAPAIEYGMGTFQRAMQGTHNFWHAGAWCFPARFNRGSYAVTYLDEITVVVAFNACIETGMLVSLDQSIVKAVFPE